MELRQKTELEVEKMFKYLSNGNNNDNKKLYTKYIILILKKLIETGNLENNHPKESWISGRFIISLNSSNYPIIL